ncbi:SCO family protein [Jannaschia sp. LMIT008]|uniref:SCO family protein n=1 Tax=Jannaschia maritima TaxID=3032585 RepID=UPI0028125EA0|nr:SCO family protein [Jannaschia sp. LMIT008]
MRLALLLSACLAVPGAAQQATLLAPGPDTAFPADIGGAYALTDHHGRARDRTDPDGHVQLVFFGYATCQAICTVALPILSQVAADLTERGIGVTPLVITVDPDVDTVAAMGPALDEYAPGLLGLTGSQDALADARAAFHVERTALFTDPEGNVVYAHGAHIYVMDGDGGFLTLLPPILPPDRMVDIVAGYAEAPA